MPNLPLPKMGVDCCLDRGVPFLLILHSVVVATRSMKLPPERQRQCPHVLKMHCRNIPEELHSKSTTMNVCVVIF